jgi:hypothetical protein
VPKNKKRIFMPFNPKEFQKSINKELVIVKDRVKNLIDIDVNHNAEDGNYREAILRNVIKRFLPKNLSIGTGFVINQRNNIPQRTTQIDIIIYDNTYPLLFQEGDFIITTPGNVKAIIEVKTTITNTDLSDILEKSTNNYNTIVTGRKKLFNGVFSFNYDNDSITDNRNNSISPAIKSALESCQGKVNHISLGDEIFLKYWKNETDSSINNNCDDNNFFNIYTLEELSFSYFISNLIDWTIEKSTSDRRWFMFPLREGNGKEDYKKYQVCV